MLSIRITRNEIKRFPLPFLTQKKCSSSRLNKRRKQKIRLLIRKCKKWNRMEKSKTKSKSKRKRILGWDREQLSFQAEKAVSLREWIMRKILWKTQLEVLGVQWKPDYKKRIVGVRRAPQLKQKKKELDRVLGKRELNDERLGLNEERERLGLMRLVLLPKLRRLPKLRLGLMRLLPKLRLRHQLLLVVVVS